MVTDDSRWFRVVSTILMAQVADQGLRSLDVSELGVKPFRAVFDDGEIILQTLLDLTSLGSSPGRLK